MSKSITTVNTNLDTFQDLFNKLNFIISFVNAEAVSVNSSFGITTGNGYVNGSFGATTLYAFNSLRGGNNTVSNTLNIVSNTVVTQDLRVNGNFTVDGNVSFANFTMNVGSAPSDGANLGNTSVRWNLYSLNITNYGNINSVNIRANNTVYLGTGSASINSTVYTGTSNNALNSNNASYLEGHNTAFFSNASLLVSGTIPVERIQSANTLQKGVVRLIDSITSNSITDAATPSSVKAAYDLATAAGAAVSGKQDSLGFIPLQQGGGIGQSPNKVYIGWSNTALKATVDSTDMGSVWTDYSGAKSFANNGYQKLPSGLIIQWGKYTGASSDGSITFPITFPNICYIVIPAVSNPAETAGRYAYTITAESTTSIGFYYRRRIIIDSTTHTQAGNFYWFAIGY